MRVRRRWVVASGLGLGAAALVARPTLVPWPRGVRPAVSALVGIGVGGLVLAGLDTARSARARPRSLLVRPAVAALALGAGAGAARIGLRALIPRLIAAGRSLDEGFAEPPETALVTGGAGSSVAWTSLGREGARFAGSRPGPEVVEQVTGEQPAREAIRVFIGHDSAPDPASRVALAMTELRRTGAFDRPVLLIESPAGSGYANPTPADVVEILMRGDCATVSVAYGLLPSFLTLNRIPMASTTQRLLLEAISSELAGRDHRPRILLYGESLGARVQQEAIGDRGLGHYGVDAALWVGTPGSRHADRFRAGLAEPIIVLDRPEQLPGEQPEPRPRIWFLEHDGDPVVRFHPDVMVRRPEWLARDPRGRHVPESMLWFPAITWLQLLVDTLFATNVRPGLFESLGHDYRADLGAVVSAAFGFTVSPETGERLEAALRSLEVARARRAGEMTEEISASAPDASTMC